MIIALVTDWISTIMNINAEYGIMYGLREIPIFFLSRMKTIAESRGNRCRIASFVTKKSVFTVTYTLFYFLHAILCPEHTKLKLLKHSSVAQFAIFTKDGVTSSHFTLPENASYCHWDIIFIDCSRTLQLGRKRSSLMNITTTWRSISRRLVFTA